MAAPGHSAAPGAGPGAGHGVPAAAVLGAAAVAAASRKVKPRAARKAQTEKRWDFRGS